MLIQMLTLSYTYTRNINCTTYKCTFDQAGNGIDSTDMIDVAWQNRGHSWW